MVANDINTTYVNEFGNTVCLVFDYYLERRWDDIKQLVENTIDINEPNRFGHLPIYKLAVYDARKDIIELAILKGANIESKDRDTDATALLIALYSNSYNTIQFLLSIGADIKARCNSKLDCNSALHIAAFKRSYKSALLLLENGVDINQTNDKLDTALHIAVKTNCVDIVKLLLEKGARTDLQNSSGYTPFDIARKSENQEMWSIFKNHSIESLVEPISNLSLDPANELEDD